MTSSVAKVALARENSSVVEMISPERGVNSHTALVLVTALLGGLIFGLDIGATAATSMDGFRQDMNFPLLQPGVPDSVDTVNQISMFAVVFHVATLIGALPSGWLADRFGRKLVIYVATVLIILGDTWQVCAGLLAPSFAYPLLLLGRVVGGLGVGFTLTIMPIYAAELSPRPLRGRVLTAFQLMITIGIFIMAFVNLAVQNEPWGWRLSIGIQIIPCTAIILLCLFLLPESPRYLVKAGQPEQAKHALRLLAKGAPDVDAIVEHEVSEISREISQEKAAGQGTVVELFRGTGLPAFLCGFFIAFCQNITGINWFMNYATTIFSDLGFDPFLFDTLLKATNVLATVFAMLIVDRVGRKFLSGWGTILTVLIFLIIATVTYGSGVNLVEADESDGTTQKVQKLMVAMIFLFQIVFAITWGPIAWLVPGEVFPLRLRGVGMGAAVTGNMITNIALGDYGYKAMSASSLGLDGTVLIVFFLNLVVVMPVVVFFQPETKNISLEDMRFIFAFEIGGNEDHKHGKMRDFFRRNASQARKVFMFKSVNAEAEVDRFVLSSDLEQVKAEPHDLPESNSQPLDQQQDIELTNL